MAVVAVSRCALRPRWHNPLDATSPPPCGTAQHGTAQAVYAPPPPPPSRPPPDPTENRPLNSTEMKCCTHTLAPLGPM